jgi:hypothetical protein
MKSKVSLIERWDLIGAAKLLATSSFFFYFNFTTFNLILTHAHATFSLLSKNLHFGLFVLIITLVRAAKFFMTESQSSSATLPSKSLNI